MRVSQQKIKAVLKRYGYKLTRQRRAVIKTVALSNGHLTAAAIHKKLLKDYPALGLVTIYRTLEILVRRGLICEVYAGGSGRSYTIATQEHHHHLICSDCGRVVDFSGHRLAELERRLTHETGFKIRDHLLEFFGLCQECQRGLA